jgi:hypothetical protein
MRVGKETAKHAKNNEIREKATPMDMLFPDWRSSARESTTTGRFFFREFRYFRVFRGFPPA